MTTAPDDDVAAAFGLGRPVTPSRYVTRGAMGEIWRLETTRGTWAVKALFEWDATSARPFDVDVQTAAADAGIRLPPPVLTSAGDAVVDLDDRRYRVYEWVELGPQLAGPVDPDRCAEVGEILGLVHSLPVAPEGDVDLWYSVPPPAARWTALIEDAREARADWVDSMEAQLPLLVDLASTVEGASPCAPITCHRDFDVSNVLPGPDGRLVTLDWENAGPLGADVELAYVLQAWTCREGAALPDVVRALLAAYRRAAPTPVELRPDSWSAAVVTQLNFLAVMADQALAGGPHGDFGTARVRAVLAGLDRLSRSMRSLWQLLELDPGTA